MLQPKSLASVETATKCDQLPETLPQDLTQSEDFWKNLFAALTDGGLIQAYLPSTEGIQDAVRS